MLYLDIATLMSYFYLYLGTKYDVTVKNKSALKLHLVAPGIWFLLIKST